MDDQPKLALGQTALALALAAAVALALDPSIPPRMARDAGLPPAAALAVTQVADAWEAAAARAGLDRPRRWIAAQVEAARGR